MIMQRFVGGDGTQRADSSYACNDNSSFSFTISLLLWLLLLFSQIQRL